MTGAHGAGQLPEHRPQRVRWVQAVIAIREYQQRRHRIDPPRAQPQHIQRRLIRPMQILNHHHRRRPPIQLVHQRTRHLVWLAAGFDLLAQLAFYDSSDVNSGPSGRGVNSGSHVAHNTRTAPPA